MEKSAMVIKKNINNLGVNIQRFGSIYLVLLLLVLLLPYTSADGGSNGFFALTSLGKEGGICLGLGVIAILIVFIGGGLWVVCHRETHVAVTQHRPHIPQYNNVTGGGGSAETQKRGLDVKVIEAFRVFKHPDVKNTENVLECAVCLSTFEDGDMLRLLPCNHVFHTGCVDRWIVSESSTCPVCRRDLEDNVPETTINAGDVVIDVLEAGQDHTEMAMEMISETQDELTNVATASPVFATSSCQG
ncbi:RING-H2 finger protein ATL11-like [Papaver somniferum]|uniref:RING-H2 finger protein ATL11-like n=1 Tax=Papaver somniferum TaxID=3469 RepID=UPI000E704871|nr:RING-H2 finger protein ATL11-like [Papaver somniferum]